MRNLRSVYNKAVKQGHVRQTEPFKNVYTGIDKTSKRAVDEQVVADLKALDLSGMPWLELARDLFLFSYCTRGMSFVDMAYLKKENVTNGVIRYVRKKPGNRFPSVSSRVYSVLWNGTSKKLTGVISCLSSGRTMKRMLTANTRTDSAITTSN